MTNANPIAQAYRRKSGVRHNAVICLSSLQYYIACQNGSVDCITLAYQNGSLLCNTLACQNGSLDCNTLACQNGSLLCNTLACQNAGCGAVLRYRYHRCGFHIQIRIPVCATGTPGRGQDSPTQEGACKQFS